jgi:hypothetical protein
MKKRKNSDSRCQALAKSGKPCRAAATEGGLCFFHANPNKASELGRIGGRKKSHFSVDSTVEPMPTLDNPLAVRDAVARLIADVYAGKVHPRIGAGLAPLLHLQMRAIEATEIERMSRRLTKLEKQLAEFQVKAEQGRAGS